MISVRRPESDTTMLRGVVNRPESVQRIIDGRVFYAYETRGHANELPDENSIDIVLTSPQAKSLGVGFVIRCEGDFELMIYENVSEVEGGTVFVPRNRNRASAKVSSAGVVIQPTSVTTNGVLYQELIIGGTGFFTATGATLEGDYAVIKEDTSYLFRLTNKSNSNRIAELFIQWVE